MAGTAEGERALIAAPFGRIAVTLDGGLVVEVDLLPRRGPLRAPRTAAGRRACAALSGYLRQSRARLELPLRLHGTAFQQRVWRALVRIPAGEVRTYGALARRLGTSARAVGNACRANPVPILIPCHRVVGAQDDGGFMGDRRGRAVSIKRWLLEHERRR